jgi:hypothetical protein
MPGPVDLGIADDGECSSHEQAVQIAITLFANAAEPLLAPARVLFGTPFCGWIAQPLDVGRGLLDSMSWPTHLKEASLVELQQTEKIPSFSPFKRHGVRV